MAWKTNILSGRYPLLFLSYLRIETKGYKRVFWENGERSISAIRVAEAP